jgi:hypothetical protein
MATKFPLTKKKSTTAKVSMAKKVPMAIRDPK